MLHLCCDTFICLVAYVAGNEVAGVDLTVSEWIQSHKSASLWTRVPAANWQERLQRACICQQACTLNGEGVCACVCVQLTAAAWEWQQKDSHLIVITLQDLYIYIKYFLSLRPVEGCTLAAVFCEFMQPFLWPSVGDQWDLWCIYALLCSFIRKNCFY